MSVTHWLVVGCYVATMALASFQIGGAEISTRAVILPMWFAGLVVCLTWLWEEWRG